MGSVAGILAGLLGIGGGLVLVPMLVFGFTTQGVPYEIIMHLALGTSMAGIMFTALSSFMAHNRLGARPGFVDVERTAETSGLIEANLRRPRRAPDLTSSNTHWYYPSRQVLNTLTGRIAMSVPDGSGRTSIRRSPDAETIFNSRGT